MANRTFEIDTLRFEAGQPMTYNNVPGRVWTMRVLQERAWVHIGQTFFPSRATRRDIQDGFERTYPTAPWTRANNNHPNR